MSTSKTCPSRQGEPPAHGPGFQLTRARTAQRDEEALVAAEEAASTYQGPAAARPAKFAPDLADALQLLSYPLRAAGRREEALAAAREAEQMCRALAAARPKNAGQDMPSVLFGVAGLQTVEAERSENECLIPQICSNRSTTFERGAGHG
jgi:hypothetical protein